MIHETSDRKLILRLALPAVLQTVVRSLFVIVDAFWVGKMGSPELAALTSATFLVWGILALGEMPSTGTNSLIAQSSGAKNPALSSRIAAFNIVNTFFYTILLSLLIIPVLPLMYKFMNLTASQASLSNEYLITLLLGFPCVTMLSTVTAVFRGNGDTKTPFYLLVTAILMNFVLAPVFIFGFFFVPAGGLQGAALSTLVSFMLVFIAGFYLLRKRGLSDSIFKYKVDTSVIKETFRIGFPIALNGVGFSLIYVFIARFVADYGTVGFAALGIGHRSESLAYQITVGFSLAASVLVGQSIGAGNTARAEKLTWKVLGSASVVILFYSVLLFVFSREVALFFSQDADVIFNASVYNKIAAAVQIFSAAEVILGGAFAGAGDSVPPAVIGLPMNALRIPLVALFSVLWGLNGIWYAICLTVVLKGIIITFWFSRGRWKNRKPFSE